MATHPAAHLLEMALGTRGGLIVTGLGALGVGCLFSRELRRVVAPVWRLLTGGLMFVEPSPWQSTWLRPAPERPENRPNFRGESYPLTSWGRLAGWRRMLIRWAAFGYTCALATWPLLTLCLSAAAGVYVVLRRLLREVQAWAHTRAVGGFATGAASVLGRTDDPMTWIAIPPVRVRWEPIVVTPNLLGAVAWSPRLHRAVTAVCRRAPWIDRLAVPVLSIALDDDDARVLVSLDAAVTRPDVIGTVKALGRRLPDGPWESRHNDRDLVIEYFHPKRPPLSVTYDMTAYEAFPVDEIPVGKDKSHEWVSLPLKKLTPHGIVSATTGWGKTTIANVIVAHGAGKGGRFLLNDPKRISYQHFSGLTRITVRTTPDGYAEHYDWFYREMNRRYQLIERFPEIKNNPELFFEPWFLLNDERGSLVADLTDWARDNGDKGKPSAIFRTEKKILWQSRAAAMYVIDLAQQANREVFIDTDGRDQRMWRIASGPQTRSSWMMLFPGIGKVRVAQRKGRAVLGIGVDKVTEVQLAMISDAEAAAFAGMGEEVARRENEARAERLNALLGEQEGQRQDPQSPGETPADVRPGSPDTPDTEEFPSPRPARTLRVIPGQRDGQGETDETETPESDAPTRPVHSWGTPGEATEGAPLDRSEEIIGLEAAATFLEMAQSAFEKARSRRKIHGEYRIGRQPAWRPLDLSEWRRQAPRAGGA